MSKSLLVLGSLVLFVGIRVSTLMPAQGSQPAEAVATLLGPFPSSTSARALGGAFARYEADFVKFDERQWAFAQAGCDGKALWECLNQYDRAAIYYVWWQRTGDTKYLNRAHQLVVDFRTKYVEGSKYGIAYDRLGEADGLALHYLFTGDSKDLLAISRLGEGYAYNSTVTGTYDMYDPKQPGHDARAQSYTLKNLFIAHKLKAPSDGGNTYGWPAVPSWETALRGALARTLNSRDPDGQWRAHKRGCPNGYQPFAVGLLYSALIRYYEAFEPDPRILPAIKASADELWAHGWLPVHKAFAYIVGTCPDEGQTGTPAADLNNLIVNGFAWVYKMTGDATYRTRADAIFAGSVYADSPSSGGKQFNQSYSSSYRYVSWRLSNTSRHPARSSLP